MTTLHDPHWRGFVSDNCAGVHPDVRAALLAADGGHQASYGADVYSERLRDLMRHQVGSTALALPVFNGTGANVLALELLAARGDAVVCAEDAHLITSEAAAPELHGFKMLPVPAPHGRIDPRVLRDFVSGLGANRARPGVLSISQSTELGTCYSLEQLVALTAEARDLGMRVHLDGARLANAAAHLGASLRELTGTVDAVSLGASKNGGMFGECVVIVDQSTVSNQRFLHKAVTQLPSKTRFVSAQLLALFEGDLWVRNAAAANDAAQRLAGALEQLPPVRVVHPVEANAVFAEVTPSALRRLGERLSMGAWHETPGVVRLMTAYDTTDSDIDALVAVLSEPRPTV